MVGTWVFGRYCHGLHRSTWQYFICQMDLHKRSVFPEGSVKRLKRLRIGRLTVEAKWYFRHERTLENRTRKKLNLENLYLFVIVVMLCSEVLWICSMNVISYIIIIVLWMLSANVSHGTLSIRPARILTRSPETT